MATSLQRQLIFVMADLYNGHLSTKAIATKARPQRPVFSDTDEKVKNGHEVKLPYLFNPQWSVWAACVLSIFYSVFIYITVNQCRVQIKLVLLLLYYTYGECERFESRSHLIGRWNIIIQVNVVLNRPLVVDSD